MSLTSNTRFALFKDNMKKKVNTVLFDRVIWSSGWVVLRTFIFGGRNWRFDNLCGKESAMLFVSVGLEVRQLIREIYSTEKQSRTTNKTNGSKLTNHDRRTLLESRSQSHLCTTDRSTDMNRTNTIRLGWCLPLRLSKRQSLLLTTILLKTTFIGRIRLNKQLSLYCKTKQVYYYKSDAN